MTNQLTAGIVARMAQAQNSEDPIFNSEPVVQILSVKAVVAQQGGQERFRLILSDGEHYTQAMLVTQLNHLVHENQIMKHTIMRITKFTASAVKDKRLIIVLALDVLEKEGEKVGNPLGMEKQEDGVPAQPSTTTTPAPVSRGAPKSTVTPKPPAPAPARQSEAQRRPTYPIESLSPYQNNWTIKARVTQKSEIKRWSNARGEGHLFNVTLMDETGEIRGTAFNAVADDLYEKFQEGKVYYITKARVNLAKKKFSNVNNDYELSFERNTEVEECRDTTNVPQVKYNFIDLSKLQELEKDSTCDVVAIVKEAGDLGNITSQKTNKTISKRDLQIVDRSGYSVRLTLWGKQAEDWNATDSPVIAIKGAKVGDFGGRTLSMYSTSTMNLNPDIVEAHGLRGWYDAVGLNENFTSHSSGGAGGGGRTGFNRNEFKTLEEVKESQIGQGDKAEYFSTRATVAHIKSDMLSYPACPSQSCNKKVNQVGDMWRCENCDRSYDRPEYRYLMSFATMDHSGQIWMQGFNDVGQAMFGSTADELHDLQERDEAKFNSVVKQAEHQIWNFSCRAKQDIYNDTVRIRYGVTRLQRLDYREEAGILRDALLGAWGQ